MHADDIYHLDYKLLAGILVPIPDHSQEYQHLHPESQEFFSFLLQLSKIGIRMFHPCSHFLTLGRQFSFPFPIPKLQLNFLHSMRLQNCKEHWIKKEY